MIRKLGMAVLYSLFGLVAYVFFLYLTFPSDVARDRLVYEANRAGIRMQLVGLSPSFPFGVTLEGVDVYPPNKGSKRKSASDALRPPVAPGILGDVQAKTIEAKTNKEGLAAGTAQAENQEIQSDAPVEIPILSVDTVTISSLLPFVIPADGTYGSVGFDAELYGGSARGSYAESEDTIQLTLSAEKLDLGRYPLTGEDYQLQLAGLLGVDADLSISKAKIRESNGTVHLSLEDLAILKGSRIKGFDIPMTLAFVFSGGDAEVNSGRVEFKNMKLESRPLTVEVNGSIMLNKTLARCRFNLKVALKFGDELAVVAAFLSSSAKSNDGYYHYIISGPFERLRTRPDRLAARKRGIDRGRRAGSVSGPMSLERDTLRSGLPRPRGKPSSLDRDRRRGRPPVLDSEERKRLREERRKRAEERRKRRQAMREARMRELQERRNMEPEFDGRIDEPGVDMLPSVPDVELRYREYDEPPDPGEPQDVVEPGQDVDQGGALGPDLPQDVPGGWEEPPE